MTQPLASRGPRDWTRRDFVKSVTLASAVPLVGTPSAPPSETPVARFFHSLSREQRATLCFPHDHPLRSQVHENWKVVGPRVADLGPAQRALCREVFRGLCGEEGHERFFQVMKDDYDGFENYHVALFGGPDRGGPFEWVLTGRHLTVRADGTREHGASFAGPVFFGHSETMVPRGRSTRNVWRSLANHGQKVFHALDAMDRSRALVIVGESNDQRSGRLRGEGMVAPGVNVGDLDDERRSMVGALLAECLRPFHLGGESQALQQEGLDRARLTYHSNEDVRANADIACWRLERPGLRWTIHGLPHVHSWIEVIPPTASCGGPGGGGGGPPARPVG